VHVGYSGFYYLENDYIKHCFSIKYGMEDKGTTLLIRINHVLLNIRKVGDFKPYY
jgi:hypothetical protein